MCSGVEATVLSPAKALSNLLPLKCSLKIQGPSACYCKLHTKHLSKGVFDVEFRQKMLDFSSPSNVCSVHRPISLLPTIGKNLRETPDPEAQLSPGET
ncbi:hypothetical protein AVEN_168477-1 [Araneus ventricosus]|uniref:Uncharacterized protein n=1 Tax=Araneus ventricosus TaxID=182803 RepID=A0A4Y2MLA2_ARAVE|nr:hypothetical protein AVEN_168477-1 [Araneus ventricosus]